MTTTSLAGTKPPAASQSAGPPSTENKGTEMATRAKQPSRTLAKVFNLPNKLTTSRLLLSVVLFCTIAWEQYLWSLVLFIIAAGTDWLDPRRSCLNQDRVRACGPHRKDVTMLTIVLALLTVASAALFLRAHYMHLPAQIYLFKPLTMVWVILNAVLIRPPVSSRYRVLIVAGLVLSLVGDVLLVLPS